MGLKKNIKTATLSLMFSGIAFGASHPLYAEGDTTSPAPVLIEIAPRLDAAISISDIYSLGQNDLQNYRDIFKLQKSAEWKKANKLLKKIDNKILMGHVLYQRYMHPTSYRSSVKELKGWMLEYPDHPGASRIFDLAIRKNNGNETGIHYPVPRLSKTFPLTKPDTNKITLPDSGVEINFTDGVTNSSVHGKEKTPQQKQELNRKKAERKAISAFKRRFKRYLKKDQIGRAEKRTLAFESQNRLSPWELENYFGKISKRYFYSGNDEKALAYALYALQKNPKGTNQTKKNKLSWTAGLAAWRLKKYDQSAQYFSGITGQDIVGKWLKSGAAFWAARSYQKLDQKVNTDKYLKIAATYPKTFYGLIAKEKLGLRIDLNINPVILTQPHLNILKQSPQVGRAIALTQVGQNEFADMELRSYWSRSSSQKSSAILTLASKLNLPNTQVRISKLERKRKRPAGDNQLYPLTLATPRGGFKVDRALIFAVIRQESEFNSWAMSYAGARGMMQLMPATARYIMQDGKPKIQLDQADYNMALGQKYMRLMMLDKYAGTNLFKMLTAYNAGPGNLIKWKKKIKFDNDPLLFVESIPYSQTRHYIESVMSNYWIYRQRLNQKIPSLKKVAQNNWPLYHSQDLQNKKVAQNGH